MSISVLQWGTGYVGQASIRSILNNPSLDLIGAWVHNPDKHGADVGTLAGLDPVGIPASAIADELLAKKPQCVAYMATSHGRAAGVVADLTNILHRGINVVNLTRPDLFYPPAAPRELIEPIEQAAIEGGATLYTGGVDPGVANAGLAMQGIALSSEIDKVTMLQAVNLSQWDNADTLFGIMGFGHTDPSTVPLLDADKLIGTWGPVVRLVGDYLGLELDHLDVWYDLEYCDAGFVVRAGVIPDNSIAAIRYQVRGIVDGEVRVIYERVNRLRDRDGAGWPHGDGYRVEIHGEPNIHLELSMSSDHGYVNDATISAAANHVLAAIPVVVAADPGIITMLDLPAYNPARGLAVTEQLR